MIWKKLAISPFILRLKHLKHFQRVQNIHVSVIGAANPVGSKLALKLKQNDKISKLKLCDFDGESLNAIAKDLHQLPGGPTVIVFPNYDLKSAVTMSHLVVMVFDTYPIGVGKDEIARNNAPVVKQVCEAISERSPDAILAISTSPVNSIIPFASALLQKYDSYNPFKVIGIANADVVRTKSYAAKALGANPRHLSIPLLGGRSEDTIVPLFSNMQPDFYFLDEKDANKLTRQIRKPDFLRRPRSLLNAWATNDCCEKIVQALNGADVELHCYAANPGFGTRFFAAPVTFGRNGIKKTANNFYMSPLECSLLCETVPIINADVAIGETLAAEYE